MAKNNAYFFQKTENRPKRICSLIIYDLKPEAFRTILVILGHPVT